MRGIIRKARRIIVVLPKTLNSINIGLGICSGLLIVYLGCLMTIEVVMRYFLKKPLAWQLDISEFVLVTVAMLAAGYTQAVDGHVKVTVLVSRFSETKRLFFRIMALVLSLGFLIPFTFYAWGAALTAIERGDSTGGVYEFPLWPVKMIMAVGLSLLCVQVIFQLCQVRLRGKPTKSAGKI